MEGLLVALPPQPISQIACTLKITGQKRSPPAGTGLTEASYAAWTEARLRPFFDIALEAFGPQRLMFGSDWPVCLLACGYARWHQLVLGWVEKLSPDEQERVLGGTAMEAHIL